MCVSLVLVCKTGEKKNVETPSEGRYNHGRSGSSWYRKPPNSKERIPRMTKANAPTQLCTWRALELNCGTCLHLRPCQHDCLWLVARTSPASPCTQFQATKATALCLFVVKLRLWASLPCHQVIVCSLLRPSSLHLSHKLGELNHFLPHASVLKTWACEGSRHLLISPGAK